MLQMTPVVEVLLQRGETLTQRQRESLRHRIVRRQAMSDDLRT